MIVKYLIIILLLLLILLFFFHINIQFKHHNLENLENNTNIVDYQNIPVVVICWNNLSFIKNFVEQFKNYPNPLLLLDNNSNYPPIFDYYEQIQKENPDKVKVMLLEKNYGHEVYKTLHDQLPDIYILSDPDLQINPYMPQNFAEILGQLSEKYHSYKVGAALDISDHDKFIQCDNYTKNQSIYEWESQFWKRIVPNDTYELYNADVDTTFCLVNRNYEDNGNNLRIAGDFTMKHLPWYKDYIKDNTPNDELEHWKSHNKSSSILWTCLKL